MALLMIVGAITTYAQGQGIVKGKVIDRTTNESLGYANVRVTKKGSTQLVKGAITDESGNFNISGLANGSYTLTVSCIGYKNTTRDFNLTKSDATASFPMLYISEDAQSLEGITVTGQQSAMKLEVDRKSFNVSQDIANAGGAATDVLENIPSVEVDNDGNISLRGNTSVEVWINGKASGLTSDNRAEILQQLPAESIERIEVIDNPSAKFSAEGSAGIINIILKKDLKPGYYGSVQAGANTYGGANTSANINMNSKWIDAYVNVGYRHRQSKGLSTSRQEYLETNQYQTYNSRPENRGNNLFSRAGLTFHASPKDELTLGGMLMVGGHNNLTITPYHYGTIGAPKDSYLMTRRNSANGDMNMYHGEFGYKHSFTDKHFLDFSASYDRWMMDDDNLYQDSTEYFDENKATAYSYQYRPMHIRNRSWQVKLDYENPITEQIKLQAGYQGDFSKENTPQESYVDESSWNGDNQQEDEQYFNRFIYKMNVHALYATATMNFGKVGIMGGLRGEYWKVNTESYDYAQEHDPSKRDPAFKKDFFQLFPSLFLSYHFDDTQQLQLNYTRRLRRPWGGELNSFKNTRDASMITFGNPQLTPEYSNSFSLNYLKTWNQHSMMVSAYYRPTSDVIQRINYQSSTDGLMYSTSMNVAKSLSTGLEMVIKNKFFKILDLTTTANAYYYKLNGFSYTIDNQTITGKADDNFTWNARMMASLILPYDITFQATGNYRSKQVVSQGYRKASYFLDLGLRKTFFNRQLTLAINCRDLLNSRKWVVYTHDNTFSRYQENKRRGRMVNFTLTWSFGSSNSKKPKEAPHDQEQNTDDQDQSTQSSGYGE